LGAPASVLPTHPIAAEEYDLFVSYRRKNFDRVLPLVVALRERGLRVWLDQSSIQDFDPITDDIRSGLANSKAFLAWYSADYPKSRPCQMELTAPFIATQQRGDVRERILVVNLEPDTRHVMPIELADEQHLPENEPEDLAAWSLRYGGHESYSCHDLYRAFTKQCREYSDGRYVSPPLP
jgi:hypothetical protein